MAYQVRVFDLACDPESVKPPSETKSCKSSKLIFYGAFKGMGDLLNVAPVIVAELTAGNRVILLIFPGFALEGFAQLIDFGPNAADLEIVHLPVSGHVADLKKFISLTSPLQPDVIWISPHVPREAASWKIPLLLWFMKKIFWRNARLAGCTTEPLSALFDVRFPVSRDLPIMERERLAYSMLGNTAVTKPHHREVFIERIRKHRDEAPLFDLVIHPGANSANRRWPYEQFAALVRLMPLRYRIAVLGLERDIEQARKMLPQDRGIQFLTGNLEQAITVIASARVLFAMDSGNVHFANFLGVPAVGLFGKSDPKSIVGGWGSVLPIYERKFACQPCGRATCNQREVYCMNSIAPETVAKVLVRLLENDNRSESKLGECKVRPS
jgi:heptosyltransferase II